MFTSSLFSRRSVLAAMTAFTLTGLARVGIEFARPVSKLPAALSSLLHLLEPSRNSAKVVGQMYLAQRPQENDTQTLLGHLLAAMPGSEIYVHDRAGQRAEIKHRISKDFDEGKTVLLDGWLVSLTEARLCAFLALVA